MSRNDSISAKGSEEQKLEITQQMLLEHALIWNPDFICMAEVKGAEAFETIEAALAGHPVMGTTHDGYNGKPFESLLRQEVHINE